jgi:hypothetical protein
MRKTAILVALMTVRVGGVGWAAAPMTFQTLAQSSGVDQSLVGKWVGGAGDGGGSYVVELELRSDGTYMKTLTAKTSDGAGYGGKHRGTWKSRGKQLFLSGDGNWPPYSHDLSTFRKVE